MGIGCGIACGIGAGCIGIDADGWIGSRRDADCDNDCEYDGAS
jgi:hypothetical protein